MMFIGCANCCVNKAVEYVVGCANCCVINNV